MIDYAGKAALITGGASGIGQALAVALAGRGARVLLADRNLEGARAVATAIGPMAQAIRCDLSEAGAPGALMAQAYDRLERLDLVCSNAGVARNKRLLKEPFDAAAMTVLEVNLFAGLRLAQAYMSELEKRGEGGRLMLTASENALSLPDAVKNYGMGVYAASKHGLLIMAEWLKVELQEKPLDLHVLLPGPVYTPLIAGGLPEISKTPPEMNMIRPERCAELALMGMDLGLFYIPTHAHIAKDMSTRTEGVSAALQALGLGGPTGPVEGEP
jgi:NAD(P)-dependent dehydrogenase (short-subunit alcohol dehydrogenase family)